MAKVKKPILTLIALYGMENRGVRYISSFLKKYGYRVNIIFFKEWANNAIKPPTRKEVELLIGLLAQLDSSLIGLGLGTPYLRIATQLTRRIKESFATPVIWGGIHPTISPEDGIGIADMVCVGEGEEVLLDLMRALEKGISASGISNLWTKRSGRVKRNPLRALIKDLDRLPFPDYGGRDKYSIEGNKLKVGDPLLKDSAYRIYPTRGCPFNCKYCNNSILRRTYRGKGRYYRLRSPANVIAELEYARGYFRNLRRIKFDGDTFFFGEDWIAAFSRLYKERIGIPFEVLLHPNVATRRTLSQLRRAGLSKIQVGLQTGSGKELKEVYGRNTSNQKILDFAYLAKELGIEVVYDLIWDNPLSGRRDKKEMLNLLLELPRPFKIYMYSLTHFPKTPLTARLLESGKIKPEEVEGRSTKSFRQYRLSFWYPRPREESFWIGLSSLTSKSFIPRFFIRFLSRRSYLEKKPAPLIWLAFTCDFIKASGLALEMLLEGELTFVKIRQYGSLKKLISQ
jgi:radical SAM superfamily enzyme YgiQ (UPF0313 family)